MYKQLYLLLTIFCAGSLQADGLLVSSLGGRFLSGLHGERHGLMYLIPIPDTPLEGPLGAFGGGVHVGGDWSSSGGFYLAAFFGYTHVKFSRNFDVNLSGGAFSGLSGGVLSGNFSINHGFFADFNIGAGHVACFYLILGVERIKELFSVQKNSESLSTNLTMVRPRFGWGSRFMVSDSIVMSINMLGSLSTGLWKKRQVVSSSGQKLDMSLLLDMLLSCQLSIGVSYALPARSIF